MTEYNLALFFHLLGAFVLISGTIVAGVAFEAARRRNTPAEIALLLGLSRVGVVLVGLGTLLVLGFGLWLVELGHWGYGAGWVVAALVLLSLTILLGRPAASARSRPASSPWACATGPHQTCRGCALYSTTERARRELHLGAAPAGDHRPDGLQAWVLTSIRARSA